MNSRSLRVRLCVLYVLISTATMVGIGCFSYMYLSRVLASSSQRTMEAREDRLICFVNEWPNSGRAISLQQKLQQLSLAIASTDVVQLSTLDGKPVYASPGPAWLENPWPEEACSQRCYRTISQNGYRIRILNHIVTLEGHTFRLSLSGRIDEHFDVLNTVRASYLLFCPLMLLLSLAGGFVLSGRALQPIHRITAEASNIGIQDLKRRIPVPATGDELQLLVESWNEHLGRVELAVDRLAQFTSDISHDLNTAITIMMTTSGLALSRDRSTEEYRSALQTINIECEATSQLLDDLLAIARADMVQQKIAWQSVNLTDMLTEVTQQFEPRASLKHQSVQLKTEDDVEIQGDPSMLRRMLSTLVDNAIKYTPAEGTISVSMNRNEGWIDIEVRDTGIGIPEYALPKIFDRFYRVDESRVETGESSGLGLAIAKWVVEAHRATIHVVSTPGQGSTFTVSLPGCM